MDARPQPLVHIEPGTLEPLSAPLAERLRVHGAVLTWMGGTFALCYIAAPALMASLGFFGAASSLIFNAMAFLLLTPVLIAGMEIFRPSLNLRRAVDPVLPFAAGSMLSWAVLHNTLPLLKPFAAFHPVELAMFLGTNAIEFTLFGMLFGTMVRSRGGAFVAGAAMQGAYIFAFVLGALLLL